MSIYGEKVYIPAIMKASGITFEQAKTCFYYVLATYFLPDELELMPILAIIGPPGTGKSDLLKQLRKMVNGPKLIRAKTYATLRDSCHNTTTALLDDADKIDEEIFINRYSKINSGIEHKVNIAASIGGANWRTKKSNVFGATIIVKTTPFKNSAVTSRSIIIKTKYVRGKYKIKGFRNAHEVLSEKAEEIDLEEMGKPTSHRTKDNWMPLRAVARYFKDEEWLEYSNKEIKGGTRVLRVGQSYEPEKALLIVFKEKMKEAMSSTGTLFEDTVLLSAIKYDLKNQFDSTLSNIQIQEILSGLNFKVVSHSGYPKVKFNEKLLNELLENYKE